MQPLDESILAGDLIDGQAPLGKIVNGYTSSIKLNTQVCHPILLIRVFARKRPG